MASVTREPAPSFEELVRALSTRQLPLPRLLRALQVRTGTFQLHHLSYVIKLVLWISLIYLLFYSL